MPRIQGLSETGVMTNSKQVKGAPGFVFSATLSWEGAAAGDKVYLLDSLTDTSGQGSTHEVLFILPTAAGTITKEWPQGKEFKTGIFYVEGPNPQSYMELTYR